MGKTQRFAVEYAPGCFHSGGSKTGASVALYDESGANRIIGRYKGRYPKARKVPVALGYTQDVADENSDDAQFLMCLDSAGVDNWHGYEFAQEEYAKLTESEDGNE